MSDRVKKKASIKAYCWAMIHIWTASLLCIYWVVVKSEIVCEQCTFCQTWSQLLILDFLYAAPGFYKVIHQPFSLQLVLFGYSTNEERGWLIYLVYSLDTLKNAHTIVYHQRFVLYGSRIIQYLCIMQAKMYTYNAV